MSSSKLAYLSKYTNDATTKKKKKKKKHKKETRDFMVEHDENDKDDLLPPVHDESQEEDDDEEGPTVVALEGSIAIKQEEEGVRRPRLNSGEAPRKQQRRRRYDSDDDDEAPPRKRRHDSDSEEDGLKRRKRYDSSDNDDDVNGASREPRRRYDSDDDDEAERNKPRRRHDSSDEEKPVTKSRRRHDSDDDDASRKVQRRYDSDDDEPRQSRSRRRYDSDDEPEDKRPKRRYDSDDTEQKPNVDAREKMSSGHAAGLQQAGNFSVAEREIQKQRRKEAQAMVDRHGMGETIYRDEAGKKVDASQVKQKKTVPQLSEKEQAELNMGRVQKQREQAHQREWQEVQESSFARYQDDTGLEYARRDVIREGDPMAMHAAKKNAKVRAVSGRPQRPVYKGPAPKPNRYGIRPGYRWDGVDRGTGFEDKVLASQYSANHKKEQAYRWSSADM